MMDFKLPKGIKIGHYNDDFTGVTVILPEKDCVCGCSVRGNAPGTRETDLLKSEKIMPSVNAVVLSGGSAYGLESASGVMKYLRERGIGYKALNKIVPIVPSAVIFDLNDEEYHYPDIEFGYKACLSATEIPLTGQVGAGKGATIGKLRGIKNASRGGVGIATKEAFGINVSAIVVVNSFGDVYDYKTNKILAGAKSKDGEFLNTYNTILDGSILKLLFGSNTTIGCIMTDARLDKSEANKLADIAHNGLAQSIKPVHTDYDGDTLFCLSTNKKKVINSVLLQTVAIEVVSMAIENAVRN